MTDKELILKARAAKSPEELLKIARENGLEGFTEEGAKAYYDLINKSGELSDQELETASGGGCAVRRNGKKMVSILNSCSHWRCYVVGDVIKGDIFKLKPRSNYLDEEYVSGASCDFCPQTDGQSPCEFALPATECFTCYYCSYEKGAWWCNNKIHYNE